MKREIAFSTQVFRARVFRRDARKAATGGLNIICGGCEHCATDYRIDRRGFPYWCLEFVAAGEGEVTVAGHKSRPLGPGSIFIYGPPTRYSMQTDPATPLVKYFVDFTGPRAAAILREAGLRQGTTAHVFPHGPIAEAFDRLIDAGLDTAPRAPRRAALLLENLLLGCVDRIVSADVSDTGAFSTYRRCRAIIDGLDATHPAIRTITVAARACHVDSAYLCRLFRRFAGVAPYPYLVHRRMEAAAAILARPDCRVMDAARELGFSDPYHFSRVFKRVYGVAPSSYLRRVR